MKTIWHTKNEQPVYDPKRADNRIICTSILLGWHLNAFVAYIEEDGKVRYIHIILPDTRKSWLNGKPPLFSDGRIS